MTKQQWKTRAKIAESNVRELGARLMRCREIIEQQSQHREWLEGERDAAKAARPTCETCKQWLVGREESYCRKLGRSFGPNGFCSEWEAKVKP